MTENTEAADPLLRTLSPLLRNLAIEMQAWRDSRKVFPLDLVGRSTVEGLLQDLRRRSETLEAEQPILVVMLMGGTGVGKSSLLNALAGSPIAAASFTRPTTREPVVYHHHTLRPDRLDSVLRHCKLVAHERGSLQQKVLVDTPDLDSNDLSNRDRLLAALPVADIVLYVGSQEKYHDKLGWEIFKEQRKRSAFAFVLNKWDRCLHNVAGGARPDEDLLADLKREGFENPLLFRTMAAYWVDHPAGPPPAEPGEQFRELARWLELGLNKLEIEAIKARGIGQLLAQVRSTLLSALPPEWEGKADLVASRWKAECDGEGDHAAELLLQTLDRHQLEIEQHFRVEGQQRFRGLMAMYLGMSTKIRTFGSSIRDQIPFAAKGGGAREETQSNVIAFIHSCVAATGERVLDKRLDGLRDRLLVSADQLGMPAAQVTPELEQARKNLGVEAYERPLLESWREIDSQRANPAGPKRMVQAGLIQAANVLPGLVLVVGYLILMWNFFVYQVQPSLFQVVLPIVLTLIVILMLQGLVSLVIPFRWSGVRERFRAELKDRIAGELEAVVGEVPAGLAKRAAEERRRTEALAKSVEETATWLEGREQAVSVAGLYGAETTVTSPNPD